MKTLLTANTNTQIQAMGFKSWAVAQNNVSDKPIDKPADKPADKPKPILL